MRNATKIVYSLERRIRMKIKKLVLIILVLMFTLSGCSNAGESKNSTKNNYTSTKDTLKTSKVSMGRYIENDASLPDGIKVGDSYLRLVQKNGVPYMYVFNSSKSNCVITAYEMNEDGTWKENTPKWLKTISIPSSACYYNTVFENEDGTQYLFYAEIKDQRYKANLLRSTDGSTYEEIKPESWQKKDSGGNYSVPDQVKVLDDGTIVALFQDGRVEFYNRKTYKMENAITNVPYISNTLEVAGQCVYLVSADSDRNITGIDVYDTANNYKKTSYPISSSQSGNANLFLSENGDIMLCDPDGIHVLKAGATVWQTVIDGSLTSLCVKTMWNDSFIKDSNDTFFILYNSDQTGYSLMKYTYDKSIPAVPSTELTVYTLTDKPILRQAAFEFQKQNPDVKISFEIALSDKDYESATLTTKEDYIKVLNTKLLAGGGPDLLVLDELPVDSFIEKNILTDISDIIQPMLDQGELYPNVMGNYQTNGSYYYVPLRIKLQLLCSISKAKNLHTLEDVANYAKTQSKPSLLGNLTLDDFIDYFSPYYQGKITDGDGKIKKEKLVQLLNDLKTICDSTGLIGQYPDDSSPANLFQIAEGSSQLKLYPCAGFSEAMVPISCVKYIKGNYTSFESSFTPFCQLGINKASKNQKICKEFLSLALSENIQKNDLNDGFSSNKKANEQCAKGDRPDTSGCLSINKADGTSSMITLTQINRNEANALVNICEQVTMKANEDEHITQVFKDETKNFFQGSESADVTADRIMKKVSVYLSE